MHEAPSRAELTRHVICHPLTWILLLALAIRVVFLTIHFNELSDDRDLYLGLAENLLRGVGFCIPGTDTPTAFRPPLYPLLLTPFLASAGIYGVALLHCLFTLHAIVFTILTGTQLRLRRGAYAAGAVIAVDPLLIRYTALPMTEVCFTAFGMLLITRWVTARDEPSLRNNLFAGVCFGLAALCRPSIWPMFAVVAVLDLLTAWFTSSPHELKNNIREKTSSLVIIACFALLTAAPWGLRNYLVFGQFRLTTTHGGYTVLLGNNETFYEAVVKKPWGTTWGDYPSDDPLSQPAWLARVQQELKRSGADDEFAADQAQYEMAKSTIKQHPWLFVRSCVLRQARFWSPVPQGPEASDISPLVLSGLWAFYGGLYLAALYGLFLVLRSGQLAAWIPALSLVITLTVVHTVFWSNARMRAPIEPVLALLAGFAIESFWSKKRTTPM